MTWRRAGLADRPLALWWFAVAVAVLTLGLGYCAWLPVRA